MLSKARWLESYNVQYDRNESNNARRRQDNYRCHGDTTKLYKAINNYYKFIQSHLFEIEFGNFSVVGI